MWFMITRNVLILLKLLSQSINFLIIVVATTENICIELCYMCMGSAPAYNVSCLVNVRTKVEKEIVRIILIPGGQALFLS